jgi:hypothetical protein
MGGMVRTAALLLAGLLASASAAADGWEGESRFSLGLEGRSGLYEFEPGDAGAVYTALRAGGEYAKARQGVTYHFTVLDPWGGSSAEPPPARMLFGGLEVRAGADLGSGWVLAGSMRYQLRDAMSSGDYLPVEEDPYTRVGVELSLRWRDRLRLSLDGGDLDVEDRTVYSHRQVRAVLRGDWPAAARHRGYASLSHARLDFDRPVLIVPAPGPPGGPPTPPSFMDHRDTVRIVTLGWEYSGPFLAQAALFAQETDSTLPDFGSTGWGVDGTCSAVPHPGWALIFSFRYEDRRLEKSYLLFDPRILTEAATNYAALSLRRSLTADLNLELGLGLYRHDVRRDFLSTGAQFKGTLAVVLKL